MGQDDVGRERGQFRRVLANLGGIGRGPAGVNSDVAADSPARLLQALMKCRDAGLHFRIVRGCGQEHTDKAHPLGLLCSAIAGQATAPPNNAIKSRRLNVYPPASLRETLSLQLKLAR